MRKSDSRALLFDLLWKYRKRFALGLVALLFVNMIEIGAPLILKETIEVITEKEPAETLYVLAGLYFLLMAGQALGRYIWRIYLGGTSMMAGNDLRKKFGLHLFNMSPSFFDRRRIGDLMSLATNDTEAIRKALSLIHI